MTVMVSIIIRTHTQVVYKALTANDRLLATSEREQAPDCTPYNARRNLCLRIIGPCIPKGWHFVCYCIDDDTRNTGGKRAWLHR